MPQFTRGLVLAGVLILAGCTIYREHSAKSFSEATGGESLERVFWTHVKDKQWVELERSLASNFVAVSPDGKLDRAKSMEELKRFDLKDYSIGDLVTKLNGNTFVVSYEITMKGSRGDQALPESPTHWMSVWQQQKSGWVLIAQSWNQ